MAKSNKATNKKSTSPATGDMPTDTIVQQILSYESEKSILLALSNDITRVRVKTDLITLFSTRLKSFFSFNHTILMLIDPQNRTYTPFLHDPVNSPIKAHPDYPDLIKTVFPVDAPLIDQVMGSDGPLTFQLEELLQIPGVPSFVGLTYEYGIKEMMITPLKSKNVTIGFILVYSDRTGNFTSEFKAILKGIAPQLSSAVSNIIINDQVAANERQNEVLLSLSNEMVNVRTRHDLLKIIDTGLKKLIDFTHNEMTVAENFAEVYHVFLTGSEPEVSSFYSRAVSIPYSVNDEFYKNTTDVNLSRVFDLRSMDLSDAPLWVKLNYAAGAREMLIKVLSNNGVPRHKLILFADKQNVFTERAIEIINIISSQLATAVNNIEANEEILKKEMDTSYLLKLSSNIAAVRTKDDLETAIVDVLQNIMNIKLAMIRVLDNDNTSLIPYMYNKSMFQNAEDAFDQLLAHKVTIHEPISAKVLKSSKPVIFNIEQEELNGNNSAYVQLWKKVGMKNAYGAALRFAGKNLGTLWLLTDDLNLNVLQGICAQISISIANIRANEELFHYRQLLEVENLQLQEQINTIYNFQEIVGQGPQMQQVYSLMKRVSESNATVLILGETGTGKELIARAIHNSSPRKNKIMIKVNCAALPANLIESELFGHEKGAFTGAIDRRIGKFELANNSTLFLDEIGELPLELQVKLLRVIQEREFERVGGTTTIKVDVRIVAATNRDLEKEVEEGKFRADLFYRLNVFPITLPSLRERKDDIIPLANFFLARYSKLTGTRVTSFAPKVITELQEYQWPGNVRELEHLIERSVLLASDPVIREIDLPKDPGESGDNEEILAGRSLEDLEREYIIEVLRRCSGKIAGGGGAAEILNVPSTTLHSKMKKLSIDKSDYFQDIES